MPLKKIRKKLKLASLSPVFGEICKINPTNLVGTNMSPKIGDLIKIIPSDPTSCSFAMVTSIDKECFTLTPFGFIEGFKIGDKLHLQNQGMNIPVGKELLGRVVNPFMEPIDGKNAILSRTRYPIMKSPISPLKRGLIDSIFSTGVKSIDGLLTIG